MMMSLILRPDFDVFIEVSRSFSELVDITLDLLLSSNIPFMYICLKVITYIVPNTLRHLQD